MTSRAAEPAYDAGAWAVLSRRSAPYLDPALGVVAAGFAALSLLTTPADSIDPRLHDPDVLAVAATVVAGLSLAWRRRRPVPAYAVFVVCCLAVVLPGHYVGLLSVLLLLSLYSLTAHGHRRRDGVLGLVVALLVFVGLALLDIPDLGTSDLLQACALLLAAWAVGDAIRSRRGQADERLQVAQQEVASAREHAARAVAEERLRIARELHDVLAHHMSLIAVQAGVGAHVIRTDVDAAERSLEVIAETSRKALTQTRSTLGLLRDEDQPGNAPPVESLADLDDLLADVTRAGVQVSLTTTGQARPLDPAVDLAAYRMVQEALTNVLKHAGAGEAQVALTYTRDALDVEVTDSGAGGGRTPAPSVSGGHGLIGLRERARILGGSLEYGAAPGAGFRVSAHLPSAAGEGA